MRRILFGSYPDWNDGIASQLDPARFEGKFAALDGADFEAFDAVVPLQHEQYAALAARPDLRGRRFWHPEPALAALFHDKLAFTQAMIAAGHGAFVPPLRPPGPPYPYVWKAREGVFGRQGVVVRSAADEAGLDLADPTWFAQALVAGEEEFAVHLLRVNGVLAYAATAGYRMSAPDLIRGVAHAPARMGMARGSTHPALLEAILAGFGYEGTACANYKLVGGQPVIFEINPRYGASLGYDINGYLEAYLAALTP